MACLRSAGIGGQRAQNLVANAQSPARHFEQSLIVRLLEQLVGGQNRFSVLVWCAL
jgi:hypothetical protein